MKKVHNRVELIRNGLVYTLPVWPIRYGPYDMADMKWRWRIEMKWVQNHEWNQMKCISNCQIDGKICITWVFFGLIRILKNLTAWISSLETDIDHLMLESFFKNVLKQKKVGKLVSRIWSWKFWNSSVFIILYASNRYSFYQWKILLQPKLFNFQLSNNKISNCSGFQTLFQLKKNSFPTWKKLFFN